MGMGAVLPGPKHAGFPSHFPGYTQHSQGTPAVLGLLLLPEAQLICIYSMTTSGKTACVKPRHNFQVWKRVCSETPDIS